MLARHEVSNLRAARSGAFVVFPSVLGYFRRLFPLLFGIVLTQRELDRGGPE